MKKLIILTLVFVALNIQQSTWADDNTWKIGALVCLTGSCAAHGDGSLKGAQLAADEINAKGGVLGKKISFSVEDTDESVSAAKALTAFKRLKIDAAIQYYIGPSWTPAGLVLAPIVAKDSQVIMTSPSLGIADFHLAGDNIFNSRGTDEASTRSTARFAIESGLKTAAIFSSQQPWELAQGNYFKDEFEKLGGKVLTKLEPLPSLTNLGSEAVRLLSGKPDSIFFGAFIQQALMAKEIKKLKYPGKLFSANIDETRLQEAQGAFEGAVFYSYQQPSDSFKQKYKSKYGRVPEEQSATGYDTVYLYAQAVESAKSFDPNKVKKTLLAANFVGASGVVKFDADGCAVREPIKLVVKQNKIERVN